jgi:tetratricopeptide (TPR) repeat protein
LLNSRFVTEKEVDGEVCLSIHRELQRSLRQNLRDDGRHDQVFNQAVLILRREFPEPSPIQAPEELKWLAYKRLLPHVSTLREIYMTENQRFPGTFRGSEAFVVILSEAGINQWDQGVNREGLEMVTAADYILQHDMKDNSSPLKADLDVLISLMMERGISERRDALERRMNVLKLRRRFAQDNAPLSLDEQIKIYNAHSDLAFSLLEYNDYIQAEKLFKICHRNYQRWENDGYANISYEFVKYWNAIASIRMLQGRYGEAERAAEEAMYLAGQLGNKSGVLKWKFMLATIYLQKGDYDRALKTHQEVRDERREKAGVYNELTLESCYAVGAIQELLGRYDEAE